jgi:CMP-N,N'-diacetyllegionaminic acid synthase
MLRVLGVIPARGGSKGVPRKNVRPLGGRPLIAWTIAAAHEAKLLTRTIVTTDDDEITEVARGLGADVPFRRPADLASDTASGLDNARHALATVEELEGEPYDAAMLLQPTTPFRTAADIDGAITLFTETGADSVISVVDVGGHHPARMKYLDGDRLIDPPFCEERENQNRQELPPMYLRNGALYLTRRDVLLGGSFKGTDCRAWIMPDERSVNIDTLHDFDLAEWSLGRADASTR